MLKQTAFLSVSIQAAAREARLQAGNSGHSACCPCNSIRKASMKSIFIALGEGCTAQWNDNEKVHKGDGHNDRFLKRGCSVWPCIRLANRHGHMGLYPLGFRLIPCHLYTGQKAGSESKGISWYTIQCHSVQSSEVRRNWFLKHTVPTGIYRLLQITGRKIWRGMLRCESQTVQTVIGNPGCTNE